MCVAWGGWGGRIHPNYHGEGRKDFVNNIRMYPAHPLPIKKKMTRNVGEVRQARH